MTLQVNVVNPYVCSGAVCTGVVTFTPENDTKARYVRVILTGIERTSVKYDEGMGDDRKTYTATNRRIITTQQIFVWGADQPGDEKEAKVLAGGTTHRWAFQFALPADLPSSIEIGSRARIRYELKAHVNRVRKMKKTTTVPIYVHGPVPQQALQQERTTQRSDSKDVGGCASCWCASGVVTMACSLNATIFLADDRALVNVEVDNKTTRPITSIMVKRTTNARWEAKDRGRTHRDSSHNTRRIAQLKADDGSSELLAPGARGEYTIEVPLNDCRMTQRTDWIECSTLLRVQADVKMSSDIKLDFPIVVAGVVTEAEIANIEPQHISPAVTELLNSGAGEYNPRRSAPQDDEGEGAGEGAGAGAGGDTAGVLAQPEPPAGALLAPPVAMTIQPTDPSADGAPIAPIMLAAAAPPPPPSAMLVDPFASVDAQPLPLFTIAQPVGAGDEDVAEYN